MDVFSSAQRSEIMRRVRSTNTRPEIAVRRVLRSLGLRFSIHRASLPGKPDIAIRDRGIVIFVHGCFWHGHKCPASVLPRSNVAYWKLKQTKNMRRDRRNLRALRQAGWKVIVIWECQIGKTKTLVDRIARAMGGPKCLSLS